MSSESCTFYLKNACKYGSSCTFSHQKPVSGTKSSRLSGICRYFLIGKCVFGDGCQRSHRGELKETNANNDYNDGGSSSCEFPVENDGISRSDQRSAGGEDVQENVQDSLLNGHVLEPVPSEEIGVDEEYAKPDVQDNGSTRDDVKLDPPPSEVIIVDGENVEKEPCIFFLDGSCGNGSACDFSHSIPNGTETSSYPSRREGPPNSRSLYTQNISHSPRKKACKHYLKGRCRLEKDCKLLHPQSQQTKSLIKNPDTSTDLPCRLDSPFDGPYGEEDSNTSPEAHTHENEGERDSVDNVVHDEAQDRMDQAPSYHNDGSNGNYSDPDQHGYDDEAYRKQIDDNLFIHRDPDNQSVEKTVRAYAKHVEPFAKCPKPSKPASYYGDGWEERSPPPPLAAQLRERQQVTPPVVPPSITYPHISEIIPHWSQFADPLVKQDVPFCKQLAQGGCSQGDGCHFRHSLTIKEYVLLFNDQQPNLWTLQRDSVNGAANPLPTAEPQVNLPHSWPPMVVGKSSTFGQECKFYPIGKCRNGDLCPFQHSQHPPVPDPTVLNTDQDWQASERPHPVFGTQDSQRPCRYYVELGYCSRGALCKFLHSNHGDHPSSAPSGPESAPGEVDDNKGWSTSWDEGNKVNEDNDWGAAAWEAPSKPEDYSAWDTPGGNDESHKPRPRNSNVCTEWSCRRGEACKFSHDQELSNKEMGSGASKADDGGWPPTHDSSHSMPWGTGPPAQCPYYLKGNCRKGSSCHMSHDSEEKPHEEFQPEESCKPRKPTNEPGEIAQSEIQSTCETGGEPKTLGENQPKAQESSQDSHILDNEATWTQPWPTETIQPLLFPMKIDAPCMRFGQGYCQYGDACNYLHIEDTDNTEYTSNSEDVSKAPLANEEAVEAELSIHNIPDSNTTVELGPIIFEHPVVERHILNCTVRFGIDATPDQITTAADSKKLILSNLPVDVSPADIRELAGPFGEIHSIISLDETVHNSRVEVEFVESSQALAAFEHLDGQPFSERHTISANLRNQVSMTVKVPEHTHVVKVSWPAPSASAWIHYKTITKAKSEAIRLDGVIVAGLQIKALYVPPLKRQKDSFAVEIRGLPVDVPKAVLEELCPEQSFTTLNPPCYTQDPVDAIRSALASCGELEDVDISSATVTRLTSVAFATFKSGEMVLEAIKALDGVNQDFLGGQPLTVRAVHYFRHRATIPQFEAVKNETDRLNEKGGKKCNIQYQEQTERRIVWIRIHASEENLATFASLNDELTILLRGMLLTSNGDVVWDDYLETSSSAKSIDTISTTNSEGPFFVQCDTRMRNVRIFGGKPDQERAAKLTMRMLQKVHKLQHEIQLPRTKLHDLVNGGIKALQDDLGVNKVSLDVVSAKVIVRGSPGDYSKVEDSIGCLDSPSTPENTEDLCQICHYFPVDPIVLTCRHAYCTLCLQMALRYSPSAPFQCISRDTLENGLIIQCSVNVPYTIIHDILPIDEEKKFLHASFLSHVRSKPEEFFFCPTLDCKSTYRVGVKGLTLKCFICASEICSFCRTRAHAGSACKGKQDLT